MLDVPDHQVEEKSGEHSKISPPQESKPSAEPGTAPVGFIQLFRFSTRFELLLDAIGLLCAMAAGAAQPLMTLLFSDLTMAFINFQAAVHDPTMDFDAVARDFRHTAAMDAIWLVVMGCGMFVCTYVYMYIWVYTGEINARRIRERYLQAVLRQDIAYFDNVGAGEVATRIQTDTHLVQQGISDKVPTIVNYLSSFVTGFILAYIRSWRLALAMTSIMPCMAIMGGLFSMFTSKYTQTSLNAVAEGGSIAEEVISAIRTAQAFGSQRILSRLYDKKIDGSERVDRRGAIWHGAMVGSFFFITYSSYGLAFNFGTTLILHGQATSGEVVNAFMSILVGALSLGYLTAETEAISNGQAAAAKLFATIDRVPHIDSADPSGLKPDPLSVKGEITLENIKFSYPSRPEVRVLKDLSLNFPAGKTSALVGASGSGKSTVISLVERFYNPSEGVIKLDGCDLKTLNIKWLRSQIGLVSQEPVLFATNIKENVAYGLIGTVHEHVDEEVKFKMIQDACIKANADSFIMKLPLGYESRGGLLSVGQRQRIAIARAIVSDPRILLLDEATSALDTQSEGIVQDALEKASAGRTTITIAHRLSTIRDADIIFVMGDGLLLEQGTHDELLRNEDGPYARLVQSQKLREVAHEDDQDVNLREGFPFLQKSTSHSPSKNELVEAKEQLGSDLEANMRFQKDLDKYSLPYLFYRTANLNSDGWRTYAIGAVCAILGGLVYPAYGIVYALGINGFSKYGHEMRFENDRVALWFFLIAILSGSFIGYQNYCFPATAATVTAKLRRLSFKAILRQDIEFFDRDENNAGTLTSELSDNPQKVNGLVGVTLGVIIQSLSTLVGGSIVGLIFSWKIGLVALACTPLLVTTGYIRLRVIVHKDEADKKLHSTSAQLACEAANSIRTVASLTREEDCLRLYSKSLEGPLKTSKRTAIFSNGLFALSSSMVFFVIALVFWYGSRLVSTLEISTFRFFVALMSVTFGAIQAGNIFSFVPDLAAAKSAAAEIVQLIDSIPQIDAESSSGESLRLDHVGGQIRLDNVHFSYPTRPGVHVLRGLNLKIERGTFIALVGASGCGKSTIIQMIERFYKPLAGHIYLDDTPITSLNVSEYRKTIASVSQEPTLYAGTVRFNILLGAIKSMNKVTQEELEDACRQANILEFIQGLPHGFDTEVGGKGSQLSIGQKQRIAIARALIRNPKILLLDEATSALDSNSEKVVQEALDRAAKGRTTIAIAHRLSSIQNADCIYVIKEGRVAEAGTHENLLARKEGYYELVQLQALSRKD